MQVSWIDPEEVGRLAAELQAPPMPQTDPEQAMLPGLTLMEPDGSVKLVPPFAPQSQQIGPAAAGDAPTGVAPEILHIREQLRLIRERAQQAGMIGGDAVSDAGQETPEMPHSSPISPEEPTEVQEKTPSSASYLALEGPMGVRLEAFATWVSRLVDSDEILLIDDQGDLLWSTGERTDLTASALLAVTTSLRSTAMGVFDPPEIIRNKLNQQKELSVLPCQTRHGVVSLAIVNSSGVPQDSIGWLREALILTVEGRGEDPPAF